MSKQKSYPRTIENLLIKASLNLEKLFYDLHFKILELPDTKEKATGNYVGYWALSSNKKRQLFVEVHIQPQKEMIVLHLRPIEYKDGAMKIFDYDYIPKWTLRKGFNIIIEQDVNDSICYIEQSYQDVM